MLVHQYFAGGDDEPTALTPVALLAQFAQDLLNVAQGQFRTLAHAKLVLDVLSVIQKHAAGLSLIAPGAAGFLQVVLQRPRNVSVHH
ncbi:hypothetical protein FQZ97_785180 [compost metagenome]